MTSPSIASISPVGPLLTRVAPRAAHVSRVLHDRRLASVWRALDPRGRLALHAVAAPGPGRVHAMKFQCDAGEVCVAVAMADDAAIALASAADIGDALRELAAQALFGELMQRMAASVLPGARAIGVIVLPREAVPRDGWCAIRRGAGEVARIAALDVTPAVCDAMLRRLRASGTGCAWRSRLRIGGAVSVAHRAMSVDVLSSLRPGDVLLLPVARLEDAPGVLRLASCDGRSLTASGRVRAGHFVVAEGLHMMDDDPALLADSGADADSLGDLELPVRFELETVSMPLAELEAVEPGYVIEFAMPVEQARLRLVSCGQVIGYADLVAISGRLGARITRLVARDDADVSDR